MFTCIVILRKYPFYVYAVDEEDAARICTKYGNVAMGVASSKAEIIFKQPKAVMVLEAQGIVAELEYKSHSSRDLNALIDKEVEENLNSTEEITDE